MKGRMERTLKEDLQDDLQVRSRGGGNKGTAGWGLRMEGGRAWPRCSHPFMLPLPHMQVLIDLIQHSCKPHPRPPRAGMKVRYQRTPQLCICRC